MTALASRPRFMAEDTSSPTDHNHAGEKMVFGVWRKVGQALDPNEHSKLVDTYHAASGESARQARNHEHHAMTTQNPELAKFHGKQAEMHDKRAKLQMRTSHYHQEKSLGRHGDHPAFALRTHLSDHGDDGGVDLSHDKAPPRAPLPDKMTTATGTAAFDPKNARTMPKAPEPPAREAPSRAPADHPAFRGLPRIPKHQYTGG
jgi:hypothetical protein